MLSILNASHLSYGIWNAQQIYQIENTLPAPYASSTNHIELTGSVPHTMLRSSPSHHTRELSKENPVSKR